MEKILLLLLIILILAFFVMGCKEKSYAGQSDEDKNNEDKVSEDKNNENYEKATFGGGCFWCMEGPFEHQDGVIDVEAGYSGGKTENPTYEEVCAGTTGHAEVVQVTYDPSKVSYEELLKIFWRQINPTDPTGQFADKGTQYRTVIFYHSEEQKALAEKSKKELEESGKFKDPIVTQIEKFTVFYPAEDYHQDYYKKNSFRYEMYRAGSGRESYINKTWKEE